MANNDQKRRSNMVRVRNGFSDENGLLSVCKTMQIEEFNDDTRTQMSNALFQVLEAYLDSPGRLIENGMPDVDADAVFCKSLLNDVFCEPAVLGRDFERNGWRSIYIRINDVIENAVFNEVLDIIQYCCGWIERRLYIERGSVFLKFNRLFEREYVGYRFIGGRIVPITDQQEIDAIESACNNPYEGCRAQIQKAVGFLSDRDNPDYKNCIKESISAVESICQIITGNNKATLGDTLKLLEEQKKIHPALKGAFTKLYGYTSDEGGIRHAEGLLESDVTFEEAKFMLVACSAFINYMIAEQGKGE